MFAYPNGGSDPEFLDESFRHQKNKKPLTLHFISKKT